MPVTQHLYFKRQELIDFSTIVIGLSFLFSLTYVRFSREVVSFAESFTIFLIFFFFMLFGKILLMKFDAYRHGFEIFFRQTYFDRFGLRVYDTISHKMPRPD